MFLPVKVDGRLLIDGMLAHAVPTVPLREMGASKVLAVQLRGNWINGEGPRHVFDVIGQCFAIAQHLTCDRWQRAADLVIEPDVTGFQFDDFARTTDLIRAGEAAARAALPGLRAWFQSEPAEAVVEKPGSKALACPSEP
jgi:NTE family protein